MALARTALPPLHDRPLTSAERLAILDRADEILQLTHRSATLGNFDDPLEEAVYILLSRQTQEIGYQRAHAELRRRWPTWERLRDSPLEQLITVLTPAGFGPTRARELKALLAAVSAECERRGLQRITLDWLHGYSDPAAEQFLTSLPGIGTKSARCVMHYSLRRDVLAVDTHVRRILDRLGIVPDNGGKIKAAAYDEAVPARMRQRLHVNLIHHGRAYCKSRSPRCPQCPLISFCRIGRQQASSQDPRPISARTRTKPPQRPVAIELFAGAGGLGTGFARAGFDVAVAVELDRDAAQTYRINHPGTVVIEADAGAVTGADLARLVPRAAKPAAIIAGPPCQGYSAAGKRKALDSKNLLYKSVVALAKELQPRHVVIENVPGMRRVEGRSFVETVNTALRRAGYATEAHLLRACDYGVPQLRHRLLFLAQLAKLGSAPAPPPATHCPGQHCTHGCASQPGSRCGLQPTPTVLESLEGLPLLAAGQAAEWWPLEHGTRLLNGTTMRHSAEVIEKIQGIKPGAGPISYRRLHADIARTIVAGHRALPVHPTLHRTISVREAARIQGFRDDHIFCGPPSKQPLQVANAVPPQLAEAVAKGLTATTAASP